MAESTIRDVFKVDHPGARVSLADHDPRASHGMRKRDALAEIMVTAAYLGNLQERLYAEGKRSLLVVLQGLDTSGKDGTIRHAMGGLNPQGVRLASFKAPTPAELRHDFLWRIRRELPPTGGIGLFNRSHYEDVLVPRVKKTVPAATIDRRYAQINRFEKELASSGTTIVKLCLHISYETQRQRLIARLKDPDKHWKFSENDVIERSYWDEYQAAYDAMLSATSTAVAPWYVIPSDRKWFRNWVANRLLVETLEEMSPVYPQPKLDVKRLIQVLRAPS